MTETPTPPPSGDIPPFDTPPFDMDEYRRRQRHRSRIMGIALIALAVLFFLITIAKIGLLA